MQGMKDTTFGPKYEDHDAILPPSRSLCMSPAKSLRLLSLSCGTSSHENETKLQNGNKQQEKKRKKGKEKEKNGKERKRNEETGREVGV